MPILCHPFVHPQVKHRVDVEKSDWIIYVTDSGQSQHFDMVSLWLLRRFLIRVKPKSFVQLCGWPLEHVTAGTAARLLVAAPCTHCARCMLAHAWLCRRLLALHSVWAPPTYKHFLVRSSATPPSSFLVSRCSEEVPHNPSSVPPHTHTPPPLLPPAAQVFAAARKAGYIPEGVKIDHVGFGLVLGEDGKKFRSRSGDVSGAGRGLGSWLCHFLDVGYSVARY